MKNLFRLLPLVLLLCGADRVHAIDDRKIVAFILHGTNSGTALAPGALKEHHADLQRVFGYRRFEALGESSRPFRDYCTDWLIPTREFYLKVSAMQNAPSRCHMNVELFHGKKQVLHSKVQLIPSKPLFISGPEWGKGRLVIVLFVREDDPS